MCFLGSVFVPNYGFCAEDPVEGQSAAWTCPEAPSVSREALESGAQRGSGRQT